MLLSKTPSKIYFILILLWYSSTSKIISQEKLTADSIKKRSLIIKTDFLNPIMNLGLPGRNYYYSVTNEILYRKYHSFQITLSLGWGQTPTHSQARYLDYNWNQYQFIPEYKIFITRKRHHSGYFIGLFTIFDHVEEWRGIPGHSSLRPSHLLNPLFESEGIGGGIMNGFQYYLFKKIAVEFIAGGGIGAPTKAIGYINGFDRPDYWLRFALNLGYKF